MYHGAVERAPGPRPIALRAVDAGGPRHRRDRPEARGNKGFVEPRAVPDHHGIGGVSTPLVKPPSGSVSGRPVLGATAAERMVGVVAFQGENGRAGYAARGLTVRRSTRRDRGAFVTAGSNPCPRSPRTRELGEISRRHPHGASLAQVVSARTGARQIRHESGTAKTDAGDRVMMAWYVLHNGSILPRARFPHGPPRAGGPSHRRTRRAFCCCRDGLDARGLLPDWGGRRQCGQIRAVRSRGAHQG